MIVDKFRKDTRVLAAVLLCIFLWAGAAGAANVLRNASFESYDPVTLLPDDWTLVDGRAEIYAATADAGAVSLYCLGGTMAAGADTPNPPRSGQLAQVVDLSTLPGWAGANWLSMGMSFSFICWGAQGVDLRLEYLPPAYNDTVVTADDPAWSGPDVIKPHFFLGDKSHAQGPTTWRQASRPYLTHLPAVRWARVRLDLLAAFKENNEFEDGVYFMAVDKVSLDITVHEPPAPCADNVLSNPGFESTDPAGAPADWHVLSGRMRVLDAPLQPAYAGDRYAGNICGYTTPNPDPEGDAVDHPDPPRNGALVQVVDLAALPGWADAGLMRFRLSGYYYLHYIGQLGVSLAYLPEGYNATAVAWDDPAWESPDAQLVCNHSFRKGYYRWWRFFETDQGSLPRVRWVRLKLSVDDGTLVADPGGQYLGGFDQVCLQVTPAGGTELVRNPGFEETGGGAPLNWHRGAGDGDVAVMSDPPAPDGANWLGKTAGTPGDTGRVYQVIDLADAIPGWEGINPLTGDSLEFHFIRYAVGARVANWGGTGVKVALAYLPYYFNDDAGITWDHPAWLPRQWVSDGTSFTNSGGSAIHLGPVIDDSVRDPAWRRVTADGWLPRVRWVRLCVELDGAPTGGGTPRVGIDGLSFQALCRQYGPYSGFGYLPEASFTEDPAAPDKPIPGWVGPEGEGSSGGYIGQTQRNYVNPAFAGFADAVADYSPSGQQINSDAFKDPRSITGRPFTDAGWDYAIVTLGDMDGAMIADYMGPSPGGTYHPGEITATFDRCPIADGPGPDFATFENGFVEGWIGDRIFSELAYVEVSSNGADFIRMPNHSLTPKMPGAYGSLVASGVFGLTGKHVNAYGNSWGTPFDLALIADHPRVLDGTVDLSDIRYVRQVDIPGSAAWDLAGEGSTNVFYDDAGNPVFDASTTWGSGGADLDAVGVLNTSATDTDGDHIVDYWDNCARTDNETQYDTDKDGYGNMCDCDLDGDSGGDGVVNLADYAVFRAAFGGRGPGRIPGEPGQPDTYTDPSENWNADADFNGDNVVNLADYAIFRIRWGASAPFH